MSQFSVSWDSYQDNVCSGFSEFQQDGDFVDMTIAAAGHVVKVHRALMALASPYLKEIIRSTPATQHPIIFLNNVDYDTLCELLEYIYSGKVIVPMDHLDTFMRIGRSLKIRGLENVVDIKHRKDTPGTGGVKSSREIIKGPKQIVIKSSRIVKKSTAPVDAEEISTEPESATAIDTSQPETTALEVSYEMDTTSEDAAVDMDDDTEYEPTPQTQSATRPESRRSLQNKRKEIKRAKAGLKSGVPAKMQYTLSTRGSLQMILNRYIYNLQWKSQSQNTRRWRCIDYRHSRCLAFVVTEENRILDRGHLHTHGFHDKKILTKLESNSVYEALDDIKGVKIPPKGEKQTTTNVGSETYADM